MRFLNKLVVELHILTAVCILQPLHRYLILHGGLQKLIPAKFRERYPVLAVGRRRRRQDVAADEEAQILSAVGLESSL